MMIDMAVILLLLTPIPPSAMTASLPLWGAHGHTIAARVAVRALPQEMPEFFLAAEDQVVYLNPEPDRWRDRDESRSDPAMNAAFAPEHWVHLDEVPAAAFGAENRYDYVLALDRAGLDAASAGMLPYRVLELAQRVRSGFRRWRAETDPAVRRWIEQRIINDAGILGHYVTDGSNPHHTTKHHDGWVGENPDGFTPGPGFHGRFESQFVDARITFEDLRAEVTESPVVLPSFRTATLEHLEQSHARLMRLYELDKELAFGAETVSAEHETFALERLAAGARMLRDMWWTAWITSAEN